MNIWYFFSVVRVVANDMFRKLYRNQWAEAAIMIWLAKEMWVYLPQLHSFSIVSILIFCVKKLLQGRSRRNKERCQWCGNHIKTTIFLGGLFVLCLATGVFTHLYIYWTKYLVKVRPDDKVMSIGAIPFPAVTICPGTKPGYPPLNFTHLLRLMQVYREPQLKLDEWVSEEHSTPRKFFVFNLNLSLKWR